MLHTVCHANAVHVTADNFNLKIRTTHTQTHTHTHTHTYRHTAAPYITGRPNADYMDSTGAHRE